MNEAQSRSEPVRENMPLQIWAWRVERLGWYLLLLVMLLALAGLFANGPLSRVQASSADGRLRVEYQRFVRNGAESPVIISLRDVGAEPQLLLGGELLDSFTVETLQPTPTRSAGDDGGGLGLSLASEDGGAHLHASLRADGLGSVRSWVRLGEQQIVLDQFIYP